MRDPFVLLFRILWIRILCPSLCSSIWAENSRRRTSYRFQFWIPSRFRMTDRSRHSIVGPNVWEIVPLKDRFLQSPFLGDICEMKRWLLPTIAVIWNSRFLFLYPRFWGILWFLFPDIRGSVRMPYVWYIRRLWILAIVSFFWRQIYRVFGDKMAEPKKENRILSLFYPFWTFFMWHKIFFMCFRWWMAVLYQHRLW